MEFEVETLALDSIRPYWRNPRQIPEEAVNAVAASIATYGYNQPIVVDTERVIVVGHTRYAALRRLGYDAAQVRVASGLTPEQARQLRVLDNRTAEFTSWDFEALTAELSELDSTLLQSYFPELIESAVEQEALGAGAGEPEIDRSVEFTCPSCFHTFVTEVTREQIMSGTISTGTEPTEVPA